MKIIEFLRELAKLNDEGRASVIAFLRELKQASPNKTWLEIIFENWDAVMQLIALLLELIGEE